MTQIFDIAIIGAGVVGSAIARELSRYQLDIALLEANSDVGMGTSKASTAIWHTGFDAKPGSLEAHLLRRSYTLMERFMLEANIPHERLGAILIAWNQEQFDSLPSLLQKAHENGGMDVEIISGEEIYRREPNIHPGALGGLLVPGEGILCSYTVPMACATQAVINGVTLKVNFRIKNIQPKEDGYQIASDEGSVYARWVINAAGLFSDEINTCFGHKNFTVTPRRGQLIVYDKLARPLVNHVLLPVPTAKTKGVLISPTVYGNILLGPTAEDLPDKTATQTTADGFQILIGKGREILPRLLDEEVTATYSGLRAATEHSDYQIEMHAEQRYLCAGGIRSTGISAALGIAEYAMELLREAGLPLKPKDDFQPIKMPNIGQTGVRPYQNAEMIARDPSYGEIVCHCERVSRGEIMDALHASIPAPNLDGLRRRTRVLQGRCQGFNCHAALESSLRAASDVPIRFAPKQAPANRKGIASHSTLAMTVNVLIVGAGPAGLAAAIALKKQGIRNVLVVDREPEAGGIPRFCHHTGFGRADLYRMVSGPRYARVYRELAEKVGVEIQTSTTITDWVASKLRKSSSTSEVFQKLSFTSPNGLGGIEAQSILLATGVRERPRSARLIPGTRPQGVFTSGSLQRFVYQEHLPVGKHAVIVGAELISLSALLTLLHAGVKCKMIVTEFPRHQIYFPYLPMKWGLADMLTRTPIVTNAQITNIFGHQRVEAIEITRVLGLQTEMVECDTIIFTGDWIPEHEMARLGGLEMDNGTRGPQVDSEFRSSVKGVFAAGNLLRGVATADHCALEGQRAARSIARFLQNAEWPSTPRRIQVEPPLSWVCPNVVYPVKSGHRFQFQSLEFRKNARIQISQGGSVLVTQAFRQLIVNEIMELDGDWTKKVDPNGEEIRIKTTD